MPEETITGFDLKQQVKMLNIKKEALEKELAESYFGYAGETKRSVLDILSDISNVEVELVKVQVEQAKYNLIVTVKVGAVSMSLSRAIKTEGVVGRNIKRVREALKQVPETRVSYHSALEKDKEYPHCRIASSECFERMEQLTRYELELHSAIGRGNGTQVKKGPGWDAGV